MKYSNKLMSDYGESPMLVGDIGGTFIRLALAFFEDGQWVLERLICYSTAQYECLSEAILAYKQQLPEKDILLGCFAVAGPVDNQEQVQLTNVPWVLNARHIEQKSGLTQVHLMNDFAAFAYSIPWISDDKKEMLKSGNDLKDSPIAAIGPGTGLGFALYLPSLNHVIPCEGGHQALVGNTQEQCEILARVRQAQGFVSIEHLLSGQGLPLLYQYWVLHHQEELRYQTTKEVSEAALSGCAQAQSFVLFFCEWFFSVIADTVLAQGARSVIVGGGLIPRWIELIKAKLDMATHFDCRPQMRAYLASVSIEVCMEKNAALFGAASYLKALRLS